MERGLSCEQSERGGGGAWVGTLPPFDLRNFQRDRQLLFVRTKFERVIFFFSRKSLNGNVWIYQHRFRHMQKSQSFFFGYCKSSIPTLIPLCPHPDEKEFGYLMESDREREGVLLKKWLDLLEGKVNKKQYLLQHVYDSAIGTVD